MDSNIDKYSTVIESLNRENYSIINSREYRYGKKILNLMNIFRNLDVKRVAKTIKAKRIDRTAYRMGLINPKEVWTNEGDDEYRKAHSVLYTCITGSYDAPQEPNIFSENIDAVMFTDNSAFTGKRWEIIVVNDQIQEMTNQQINRFYKMHPFDLFEGYDFAVYIDGNIKVVSDICSLFSIARNSKTGIALHYHSDRDCLYDEAETCLLYKRGNPDAIRKQVSAYHAEGFPSHYGLLEATIIVTDLKNPNARDIYNLWWKEYLTSASGRDQLALPYCLWKLGYTINDCGCLGTSVKQNPKFRMPNVRHNT